jgi:hypothetical protein
LICDIEVQLHRFVRETLESAYKERWWRDGIPEQIRIECQALKEKDSTPLEDPYHYTTFIHLKTIIDKNWSKFFVLLPKAFASNKQNALSDLQRLSEIRNRVMHPVKTISSYKSDYRLARKFLGEVCELIEVSK